MALALVAGAAACGTRLPDDRFADRAGGTRADGSGTSSDGGLGSADGDLGATDGTAADGGTTGGTGGATAGGTTGGSGGGTAGGAGGAPSGPNQASDVGVSATSIRVGALVAEQGVLGDAFAPAVWGVRAWVADTNAKGGIGGRKIELFTCDDREDRARSLECAKQLVETNKVFAIIATNSRALGGAAEYLEGAKVPVLGIPITNTFNRFSHFFSAYGSPYPRDGKQVGYGGKLLYGSAGYRYFKDKLGAKKAAVFGYDIAESSQALDLFKKGLELEGYSVKQYLVSFAAPSFDTAVADMQREGTQLIVDAMDGGANAKLCDTMARRGFKPLAKITQIPSFSSNAKTELNDTCRDITYITGGTRPYTDTSIPFIATFQQAMAKYQKGKYLHQWELEAWMMADWFRQYLVAAGPAPTRTGFEAFLERPEGLLVEGVQSGPTKWVYDPSGETRTTGSGCYALAKWDDEAPGGWISPAGFPFCVTGSRVYLSPTAEDGT